MSEYALLINNTLKEIRHHDTKPDDIPHKNITWHEVVREYGTPFEGLENDIWVIRTVDPNLITIVPSTITPRQCRLVLFAQGLLPTVEDMITQQGEQARITWEYAVEFNRNDPLLNSLGAALNLTEEQIDQMFIAASQL